MSRDVEMDLKRCDMTISLTSEHDNALAAGVVRNYAIMSRHYITESQRLQKRVEELRAESDRRLCIIENLMSVFHDPTTCQCVYHDEARKELSKDHP